MLDWVDVLRRILHLYNVKTQQELGMALGVPVRVGLDGDAGEATVPWQIMELVVHNKRVSWDWLLTGRQFQADGRSEEKDDVAKRESPPAQPQNADGQENPTATSDRMRYADTRELARDLLPSDDHAVGADGRLGLGPAESGAELEFVPADDGEAETDSAVRELERLRDAMRREVERLDRLLAGRNRLA